MSKFKDIAKLGTGLFGAGVGLVSSLSNIIGGNKDANEAQWQIDNFEFPELQNVFEGMRISTLGADILREDAARTASSVLDAARSGGTRTLFGAIPKVAEIEGRASRTAAADLDRQMVEKERLVAGDEARIQGIEQARAQQELEGLGAKLNYANQRKQSGWRDLMNLGFAGHSMLGGSISPTGDVNNYMPRNYGF